MDEQDEIQTKPTVTYTRKPKKQPKQKSAIEILDIQYTQDELNEFQAKLDSGEFNIAPNIPPCTEQHDNQPFDRICASIVGLAWGDVLGSPVEGYRWYHIRPIYAKSDEIVEPVPDALFGLVYDPSYADRLIKPYYHQMPDDIPLSQIKRYGGMKFIRKCRPLGFWSDDTQQALALLNCLLLDPTAGEIFVEEWRQWIIRGWQTKAWRGVGGNFTNASKLLAEPANSVYQCGSDSMGIGAAMKIGPIGAMLRWASISELSNAIAHATFVTHASLPGASLSFAVAYIVQQFVNGQEVNSIRANLIDLMRSFETEYQQQHLQWKLNRDKDVHLMSDTMKKIFAFMEESSESDPGMFLRELRDFISETAKQYFTGQDEEKMDAKSKKIKAYHVNQGPVILGGAHALAVSLISKLIIDPDDILISICQLGYDTDTVAAIAGTMLGARYGMSFLKPHLTQIVNSQLLVDYALRLSEFDPANENTHTPLETIEQYMKRESLVTATEKALQKDLKSRQIN